MEGNTRRRYFIFYRDDTPIADALESRDGSICITPRAQFRDVLDTRFYNSIGEMLNCEDARKIFGEPIEV